MNARTKSRLETIRAETARAKVLAWARNRWAGMDALSRRLRDGRASVMASCGVAKSR